MSFSYTNREEELSFKLSDQYALVRDKFCKNLFPFYFMAMGYSVLEALVIMIPFFVYSLALQANGKTENLFMVGFTVLSTEVVVHHVQLALITRNWNWF